MYKNVGERIAKLAEILTVIIVVSTILIGICLFIIIGKWIGLLCGLTYVLIGAIAAWVSNLILAGFGDLIVSNRAILESTKECVEAIKKSYNSIVTTPIQSINTKSTAETSIVIPADKNNGIDMNASNENITINCPNCGASQNANRQFCNKCGTSFK